MQELYLVFAEELGETQNDEYIYRFLFSPTPEVVWGERFNVTPAAAVSNLIPLPLGIEREWRVVSKMKLETATTSTWFSMQDCMDDIIALVFSTDEEASVVFRFGESDKRVREVLDGNKIFYQEMEYVPNIDNDGQ